MENTQKCLICKQRNINFKSAAMKDVAKEAGVALRTVSKVINKIPVGEEYKIKAEEAIKKLGYEVDIYARGMKKQIEYPLFLVRNFIFHILNKTP